MWWKLSLTVAFVVSAALGGSNVVASHEPYVASLNTSAPSFGTSNLLHPAIIEPDRLYHKVWQLISEDFYKPESLESWSTWEHRYDGKLKTMDDAHLAIETMLASLGDRYTRFLDREAFDDEKSQIDAKLYGIGVQIGIDKNHKIVVISPIEDTPASRAGLQPLDEIAEINDHSTKGWSVEEAAKQIRGAINTDVKLTLQRGKEKIRVRVTRAEIPIKAVSTSKLLDNKVGYIRLASFISQLATKEMHEAVQHLAAKGAQGIILDLRENPGGLLTNAIDISNMFLNSGNIVSTVDRDGYKTPAQSDGKPLCKLPLVVLINKGSASASEITSGALRDNGRAILIGQTTYGKGLVQGINRLDDGSGVNITIAKYLTPNDTDINKIGIVPDVSVALSDQDLKDGKGAWWLDPNGPNIKRSPEDMKDIQLKAALDEMHKKLSEQVQTAVTDDVVLKAQIQQPKP